MRLLSKREDMFPDSTVAENASIVVQGGEIVSTPDIRNSRVPAIPVVQFDVCPPQKTVSHPSRLI